MSIQRKLDTVIVYTAITVSLLWALVRSWRAVDVKAK
jgi:hypothetical protein